MRLVKCYQGNGERPDVAGQLTAADDSEPGRAGDRRRGNAIIGPFPVDASARRGVSVLASVSATGDAATADTVNGAISNRRLVPNDTNVAQVISRRARRLPV